MEKKDDHVLDSVLFAQVLKKSLEIQNLMFRALKSAEVHLQRCKREIAAQDLDVAKTSRL